MPVLICPVCGGELNKDEKTYFCAGGHSFDIARQGYVNLYMSSAKGKRHGDDRLMVAARADFLSKGYYDRFSREICRLCIKYAPPRPVIIDAGCGEGKYTFDVLRALESAGKEPDILGIDISKYALMQAARRGGSVTFAAASSAKMPVMDGAADMVLNIFSPFAADEFLRILSPGGKLIRAYPLKNHLFELKAAIYDTPYENPDTKLEETGFKILETGEIKYKIALKNGIDVQNLFKMTPYYYKTGESDQRKLAEIEELDLSLEFGLCVYEKI